MSWLQGLALQSTDMEGDEAPVKVSQVMSYVKDIEDARNIPRMLVHGHGTLPTARSGLAVELSLSMTAALQAKPLPLDTALSSGTFPAALDTLVCCAEPQS